MSYHLSGSGNVVVSMVCFLIYSSQAMIYFSQKQLPRKMKSRLVIIMCAGYIFWQLFLWRLKLCVLMKICIIIYRMNFFLRSCWLNCFHILILYTVSFIFYTIHYNIMLQNEEVCGNTIYSSSEVSGVNHIIHRSRRLR